MPPIIRNNVNRDPKHGGTDPDHMFTLFVDPGLPAVGSNGNLLQKLNFMTISD